MNTCAWTTYSSLQGKEYSMRYNKLLRVALIVAGTLLFSGQNSGIWAATPQVPMPGSAIPQFVDPLPTLTGTPGTDNMESALFPGSTTPLYMREFKASVLPLSTPTVQAYTGTSVFGYRLDSATTTADTYIGPVFVTKRGTPTAVQYVNNLGDTTSTNVALWKYSVDQSLHWANPGKQPMMVRDSTGMMMGNPNPYSGPIPAVPHLHGAEVPAAIDGSPDAWFLSTTAAPVGYSQTGPGYYTSGVPEDKAALNEAIYHYPNNQEAGPLWFHDHLLGGTRLNVYAGLAGAYLLTDPTLKLPDGMAPDGLINGTGGATELTIPLVLQDRMFDTSGELYFPDAGINPMEHLFWIPEFVGDTIVVNGKSWPYLTVEPKRYRFMIINGSNARFYHLKMQKNVPMFVIATDGGYLDNAVQVSKLLIAPGERYEVILDFGKFAGKTLLMTNNARTPFPKGTPPDGATLGKIIQFRVKKAAAGFVDKSYNPATTPQIRATCPKDQTIQRLVDPATGTLNPAVTIAQNRQLTLNEIMGMGGPLEILVNNTKWNGKQPTGPMMASTPRAEFSEDGIGNYLSELPAEGTTEVWEIINLTADAHPIHLHLVQFQILNRQNFKVNKYLKTYNAAFLGGYDFTTDTTSPAGVFIPAYGPPNDYNTQTVGPAVTTIGGNPDVTPFLQSGIMPPDPNESGWKDTAIMYPGMVTRIAVRFMPTDTPVGSTEAYPFTPNLPNADPTKLSKYNYVWHCHIIDHEDNEMMRPYQVTAALVPEGNRSYQQGIDY
jgi:spore coat protein A, manganese oxidase